MLFLLCLFLLPLPSMAQSKSITRFRSDFKEDNNLFFYSSTLKMLNKDNDPNLVEILNDIDEIRVLNYNKTSRKLELQDIVSLKNALQKEQYQNIMMVNEKGNSLNVYGREKNGKPCGFVAIIENTQNLVLIDLIGTIDMKKFMALQKKIPIKAEDILN
jgi:hypothetical protein